MTEGAATQRREGEGRLAGDVALVTGSTSGLGAEIARLFAAEGARVVVTGRDSTRGATVVDAIAERGGEATFLAAELSEQESCRVLVREAAAQFGGLSILVNNAVASAGPGHDGAAGDVPPGAWDAQLRVSLLAPAWLIAAALPELRRFGRGSIVNVSSRTAERAPPGLAAYTAAKGGLNALTRSVAVDYAADGIRCNTVQPGYIWHAVRDANATPERRERVSKMHLTRVATARDVAQAALFFAGPESEVITGATLPVDGGSSIARAAEFG